MPTRPLARVLRGVRESLEAEAAGRRPPSLESEIQRINGENTAAAPCDDDEPDYIHFAEGCGLPYLPYAFTNTCSLCGKVDIPHDPRRSMPLSFLRVYLARCCVPTPFVYNILYQMAFYPELEEQEARKWGDSDTRRGRVCFCVNCNSYMNRRARPTEPAAPDPAAVPAIPLQDDNTPALEWQVSHSGRYTDTASYTGEGGRGIRKPRRGMLQMDQVLHMLHMPDSKRVPEYRTTARLINTLTAAPVEPGGIACLYACFRSIHKDSLMAHAAAGHITSSAEPVPRSEVIHLLWHVSGGKRRLACADSQTAVAMRQSAALLLGVRGRGTQPLAHPEGPPGEERVELWDQIIMGGVGG